MGHQRATELAENYLSVIQGNKKNIGSVISQKYDVMSNRKSILSIIDIIMCLGQRNMTFPGTWEEESKNGNFRHFVSWKAEFDSTLKQHLQAAPQNGKYLSPKTQNELIGCSAEEVRETLLKKTKEVKDLSPWPKWD